MVRLNNTAIHSNLVDSGFAVEPCRSAPIHW